MILSNPCFEVWFLLHFRFSTKGYNNNEAVLNDLKKYWPQYEKKIGSYAELQPKTIEAVNNAKKVKTYFEKSNSTSDIVKCNSSTDVYKFVEVLLPN